MEVRDYTVRKPTEEELDGIAKCLAKYHGATVPDSELMDCLELSFITVLDGYITDTPIYSGPIFTIHWSGYHTFHTMIGREVGRVSDEEAKEVGYKKGKLGEWFMIFDYCDTVNFPLPYGEGEDDEEG